MSSAKRVSVLGAGSWGTAICQHLTRLGHEVSLWGRSSEVLDFIEKTGRNERYFPDLALSEKIRVQRSLETAAAGANMLVFAVPSSVLPGLAREVKAHVSPETILLSTAKGLEGETLRPMSSVLQDIFGENAKVAVLSGPSFAREVILGLPTAVTMASKDRALAHEAAAYFHSDTFRVYTTQDVLGVEFGGAVKNIIALASGVVEGRGMGANARAALITRGLHEMQRLAVALGGQPTTIVGLSGLGDLLLTATGDLSRNRQVGLRLGKGEKLPDILSTLKQTAEAVLVTPKVVALGRKLNVSTPIVDEIDNILSGKSGVEECVKRLLSRAPTAES